MTDMLQKGQEWLASKLTQHASRQVVYRRGELGATLQATIGKSMYDQDDGEGIVTRSQVRDFLIDTQSLLQSIIGTLPRRGDTIVEIDGSRIPACRKPATTPAAMIKPLSVGQAACAAASIISGMSARTGPRTPSFAASSRAWSVIV